MITLIKYEDPKVIMIRMSQEDAIRTIESLAWQIGNNNSNGRRHESFTEDGYDFSIAVTPEVK